MLVEREEEVEVKVIVLGLDTKSNIEVVKLLIFNRDTTQVLGCCNSKTWEWVNEKESCIG